MRLLAKRLYNFLFPILIKRAGDGIGIQFSEEKKIKQNISESVISFDESSTTMSIR